MANLLSFSYFLQHMSNTPSRVRVLSLLTIFTGVIVILLGYRTSLIGSELAATGGEFGHILDTLGGFWQALGLIYMFLGILCLPLAAFTWGMKDWARRNGALVLVAIAAISIIMGTLVGFYSILESIPLFVALILGGYTALGLSRRQVKDSFEFGHQGESTDLLRYEGPVKDVYYPKVVMRAPQGDVRRTGTRKCHNCGTVNLDTQSHCKTCGKRLE
jgi:hypothetical protein